MMTTAAGVIANFAQAACRSPSIRRGVQIMSATGLATFAETVQLSNQWLDELMRAVCVRRGRRPPNENRTQRCSRI
jgi:hypothetical protein